MGKSRSAFSLIEVLVTMGVVGLLAAMTAAGMSKAAARSRSVTCLNNLRGLGAATLLYAGDNNGRLPASRHQGSSWVDTLDPYLDGKKTYRCPDDLKKTRIYSYAINDFLTPHPYGAEDLDYSFIPSIPHPARTLLLAECDERYSGSDHFHFADGDSGYGPAAFAAQVDVSRHADAANYLFADGRVEALRWKTVRVELQKTNSQFIHP